MTEAEAGHPHGRYYLLPTNLPLASLARSEKVNAHVLNGTSSPVGQWQFAANGLGEGVGRI
jgi:hypothetical protein